MIPLVLPLLGNFTTATPPLRRRLPNERRMRAVADDAASLGHEQIAKTVFGAQTRGDDEPVRPLPEPSASEEHHHRKHLERRPGVVCPNRRRREQPD